MQPAGTSRLSARSSFATNFDQGLMFRIDSPTPQFDRHALGVVPEFPPMAEVRERNSVLIPTGGAVARRESLNSMMSNGSNPDTQYLLVNGNNSAAEAGPLTPMSVRPFSPSESFVFPKPPPQQGNDWTGSGQSISPTYVPGASARVSPQSSAITLVHGYSPNHAISLDVPTIPKVAPSVSPPAIVDPFADPTKPEFADVETIRRPFAPTLDDELSVVPGDRVRIMQIFDDGWAFVEKFSGSTLPERGLIPVDCLREAGQALPNFLAQKRVSSYGGSDVGDQPVLQKALEQGHIANAF
ncbi:hypothetical protein F5I97DRAFT_1393413 [Phlebopus sp. FC_14]|nr:hypothetical protein F5I97DRAFT_1393413 [Phlebopus sp. FC_14]